MCQSRNRFRCHCTACPGNPDIRPSYKSIQSGFIFSIKFSFLAHFPRSPGQACHTTTRMNRVASLFGWPGDDNDGVNISRLLHKTVILLILRTYQKARRTTALSFRSTCGTHSFAFGWILLQEIRKFLVSLRKEPGAL